MTSAISRGFLILSLLLGINLLGLGSWAGTELRPAPRFSANGQNFDKVVLKGSRANLLKCLDLLGELPGSLAPTMQPEVLKAGLSEWTKTSKYTPENIERLVKIETGLPPEQLTYLHFQHKEKKDAFSFIRLFSGENDAGISVPLVMERKFPDLKISRDKHNVELGLLTKSEEMGDVAEAMLIEVVKYLQNTSDPAMTALWATARKAQARLYAQLGFRDTGGRTPDGMMVLSATLENLIQVNFKEKNHPVPMLSAEEFKKWREDNKNYSTEVQNWYKVFWHNEEILQKAEDKESLQWALQDTVRPAQADNSFWLLGDESTNRYTRYCAEKVQDKIRWYRQVAAQMIVNDRTSAGISSSHALRQIAFHNLDFDSRHRFQATFTSRTIQRRVGRMIYNMSIFVEDQFIDFEKDFHREQDRFRMENDPELRKSW